MERLTYDFCIGENHCWEVHGADNNICADVCKEQGDKGCEECPIRKAIDRLAAYEDIGTPEEINRILDAYGRGLTLRTDAAERLELVKDIPTERLRELAQTEKDGRLVVLPFCVGVPLYEVTGKGVREHQVEQFSISKEDLFIQTLDKDIWYRGGCIFGPEQIGKTVFLAREEAEAALKKREGAK